MALFRKVEATLQLAHARFRALRGPWNRIEGWNNGDTEIRSDVYTRR